MKFAAKVQKLCQICKKKVKKVFGASFRSPLHPQPSTLGGEPGTP